MLSRRAEPDSPTPAKSWTGRRPISSCWGLSRLYPYRAVSWRCIPLCGSRWEQAAPIHIWHLANATAPSTEPSTKRRTQMGCANFVVFNHKYIGSKPDRAAHPSFFRMGSSLRASLPSRSFGANEGEGYLCEAFVVPATTIRKYLERLRARLVATDQRTIPASYKT
jgi:hypothetical protein